MKIFLDTANVAEIKKWSQMGIIDGVTTNPSHLSKEGGNPVEVVKEILKTMPNGEISVEVTETDPQAVYEQAKKIAALGDNVLVKIPCAPEYYDIIKKLVEENIKLNITLVFTLVQSLMMCKLGVTYISPFIGRLTDIDEYGVEVLHEIKHMQKQYGYSTGILAASIRSVDQFHGAIDAGVDVATLSIETLEKAVKHPLTKEGMEKFDADWKKLGIKQFP
ncbi:MAG TPA: transaldolase family protein [Candidatus Babeliales bacterium]|nr:transaldolase family protein [Candidatus Babeliales bacterium]